MSYDLSLKDPKTYKNINLQNEHFVTGGTYCLGGTKEAWLNVTYNYAKIYYKKLDKEKGIRVIHGMTAEESLEILEKGINSLKDDVTDDYWEATEGNAKKALLGLLEIANMAILEGKGHAIWEGD